jgi:hypothetical protein
MVKGFWVHAGFASLSIISIVTFYPACACRAWADGFAKAGNSVAAK